MRNRCIEVALAELEAVGIRDVVVAHGSNQRPAAARLRRPWNAVRSTRACSRRRNRSRRQRKHRTDLLEQRVTALEQTLAKLLTPAISREVIPAAGEPEKSPSNGRSCHHGKN